MKYISKIFIITFTLVIFSTCSVFLGPEPENTPMGIFDAIWNDFDRTYGLFDHKNINWNQIYDTYVNQIHSDMSERELFNVCSGMLGELNDAHVSLSSYFAFFNSGGRLDPSVKEPFSLDLVTGKYLKDDYVKTGDEMFVYGRFKTNPSVGYIFISGFFHGDNTGGNQDWINAIDNIIGSLSDTEALVLDIRGNRGGLPGNLEYIASRFIAEEKDYMSSATRNGPGKNDFSPPVVYTISPSGTTYTKPIALITNLQTISAGEWFTAAVLTQDHIRHTGSATCGAFSLALRRFLVNGWSYAVSVQTVRDMNGVCHEETGIVPHASHIKQNTDSNIEAGNDDQLEYALSILQ